MDLNNIKDYNIILASKSPRRQQLLRDLGLTFSVSVRETEENYPDFLSVDEIPVYLAKQKALAFEGDIYERQIIITADTIVAVDDSVLGKPADREEAVKMLRLLSGRSHRVISGVCLLTKDNSRVFSAETKVYFKELTDAEIDYYVDNYRPYDKAGAYGIQEWIGYIGVERIEGSYFNVVGLPVQRLYAELQQL